MSLSQYTGTNNPFGTESLMQYDEASELLLSREVSKIKCTQGRNPFLQENLQYQGPKETAQIEAILNFILPPREWDHEGKHFIQYVSHNTSDRADVAALQKLQDERLLARQARESGICPIREELHSQCFDEIIRQVTIDCPERGLLLMRVRDELKMTIFAYQTLYKSAVSFGLRKQIQAEDGKKEIDSMIKNLEKKKNDLRKRQIALENKKKAIERRIDEKNTQDEYRKTEERSVVSGMTDHLSKFFVNLDNNKN